MEHKMMRGKAESVKKLHHLGDLLDHGCLKDGRFLEAFVISLASCSELASRPRRSSDAFNERALCIIAGC